MATLATDIHVGDIGTIFRVTIVEEGIAIDISSATTLSLVFKKPDKTLVTKTATFFTNGKDGIIQYTAEDGFLDIAGVWNICAVIKSASTNYTSTACAFTVKEAF